MKESTSRRLFLQKSALATTGVALLSSGIANAFTNEIPYDGYNPYSENKTDLRTTIFEKHVRVKGTVYDKTGSIPVPNAAIEVWHLSPNSTKYRHRTKLRTDHLGQYNFITDFPNREVAQVSRIYFKLSHKDNSLYTELAVDQTGASVTSKHWEENQHLGDKLHPSSENFLQTTTINFNLSI